MIDVIPACGQFWRSKRNPNRLVYIDGYYFDTKKHPFQDAVYVVVVDEDGFVLNKPAAEILVDTLTKDYKLEEDKFGLSLTSKKSAELLKTRPTSRVNDLVLVDSGSITVDWEPSPLLSSGVVERLLLIPDTHSPFHDPQAWRVMINAAKIFKPTIIIILGDFADFYAVSDHRKNPERLGLLQEELGVTNGLLDEVETLGAKRVVFVEGNHEWRLFRYLCDKAPALYGLISTEQALRIKERGWEFVPYGSGTSIGKLYVTHTLGKTGRYSVHKALEDGGRNIAHGHSHVMGVVYRGSSFGNTQVGACFGWLARYDVASDYKHELTAKREYTHGFGTGCMLQDGTVFLQAHPIVKNCTVVNGEVVYG